MRSLLTGQSDTVTADQQFVESGTYAEFKRCVLENIGWCGHTVALWGTYAYDNAYVPGNVVVLGADVWRAAAPPLPPVVQIDVGALPPAAAFAFMGTFAYAPVEPVQQRTERVWNEFLQDHGIVIP